MTPSKFRRAFEGCSHYASGCRQLQWRSESGKSGNAGWYCRERKDFRWTVMPKQKLRNNPNVYAKDVNVIDALCDRLPCEWILIADVEDETLYKFRPEMFRTTLTGSERQSYTFGSGSQYFVNKSQAIESNSIAARL
jgi:hypothetical protein